MQGFGNPGRTVCKSRNLGCLRLGLSGLNAYIGLREQGSRISDAVIVLGGRRACGLGVQSLAV